MILLSCCAALLIGPILEQREAPAADGYLSARRFAARWTVEMPSGDVRVNDACAEELEQLPGVGAVLAGAILDDRGGPRAILLSGGLADGGRHRQQTAAGNLGTTFDGGGETMRWRKDEETGAQRAEQVRVTKARREMDFVTLRGQSVVTFSDGDGEDATFLIPGDNGMLLREGDTGELTALNGEFVAFRREDGETVGTLFVLPREGGDGQA